jgi:hypothetical protein
MGLPSEATDRSVNPSLVNSCHKSPFVGSWSRRQKRLFHRGMSGIEIAWSLGEEIRFLTLTSSNESDQSDIHRSWERFVKCARRGFGRFESVAVKEVELSGRSNIHCLFRGSFIPQGWISSQWSRIHRSPVVDIRMVNRRGFRSRSKRSTSAYLVKYLGKNEQGFYRFWCSQGWVFRGFVGFWRKVVQKYQDKAVAKWSWFLRGEVELFDRLLDRGRLAVISCSL